MRLKHPFFVIFAITALVAINGPQTVEASFWDGIPIISQIKSAFQAATGDLEGAKKTQENFLNQAPVVSQIKSAIESASGDDEAARRTQEQFLHETIEPVVDNTPIIGHIKGGIHIAAGDTERGEQILKGASSTTAAVLGGIVAGPVGAIAGGALGDAVITTADTIKNNEHSPFGIWDYLENIGNTSAGDHFDNALGIGTEFIGGKKVRNKGNKAPGKLGADAPNQRNVDDGASHIERESNKRSRSNDEDVHNEAESSRRQRTSAEEHGPVHSNEAESSRRQTSAEEAVPVRSNEVESNRQHTSAEQHNEPSSSTNIENRRLEPSNPRDFEIIKQRLGLPEEYSRQLQPIDFRLVNDVNGLTNCYQCSLAALKRKTVTELHRFLNRELDSGPAKIKDIEQLYIDAGYPNTRLIPSGGAEHLIARLNNAIGPGQFTQFSLGYSRAAGRVGHVVHFRAWKDIAGKLYHLITDFQKPPNMRQRFSTILPHDAAAFFVIFPGIIRELGDLENPNLSVFYEQPRQSAMLAGNDTESTHRKYFEANDILNKIVNELSGHNETRNFSDKIHIDSLRSKQFDGGHKCSQGRRIIGYVPHWSYRPFSFEQSLNLTNAIYAFVEMSSDGSLKIPDTSMAKERMIDLILTRTAHNEERLSFKVSFAVGGWVNSQYFSNVLNDGERRSFFIREIERIIVAYKFDGVDIDWEYPGTGGATEGIAEDKQNYVTFLRELREKLGSDRLISIAGGGGQEAFGGFDVPNILKYVDWISVMTYDFNGAWDSQWGAFVGPNAPLYHSAPAGYSGKLNVNWAIKQYVCTGEQSNKIVMGIPFYGRYWYQSMPGPKADYPLYRRAERLNNGSYGDSASYWQIMNEWHIDNNPAYQIHWDDRSKTPWMTDGKMVLSYDNERSILEKVQYANSHNLGGVMIWSVDQDDLSYSLLRTVFDNSCYASIGAGNTFKCNPLGTEKRWWTWLEDKQKAGMCGKNAPLYKGFYPLCDPDDPGYSCCSAHGYCGSGSNFCDCPKCVDFGKNPDLLVREPVKPSRPIEWHIGFDLAKVGQPRCGSIAPKLADGREAICNPDGNDYCCSSAGYCGSGQAFCECNGCVNHRTGVRAGPSRQIRPSTSSSQSRQSQQLIQPVDKRWYTWADGPLAGRCGSRAPKINGETAICNPNDSAYHCCSSAGYCGSGSRYCECRGCVNHAL